MEILKYKNNNKTLNSNEFQLDFFLQNMIFVLLVSLFWL